MEIVLLVITIDNSLILRPFRTLDSSHSSEHENWRLCIAKKAKNSVNIFITTF